MLSIPGFSGIRGYLKPTNPIRVASFPSMDVDKTSGPNKGKIYIVWANATDTTNHTLPYIYLISSTNGGSSWSTKTQVNNDYSATDKWEPWVNVDSYGGVNVVFYDSRIDPINNILTQAYLARSNDAGSSFPNYQISDVAFTPAPIPNTAHDYMGDYIGITSTREYVIPCWNDNRTGVQQAYIARYDALMDLATSNKSVSNTASSGNNQRKLIVDASGKYHEVFGSGGEIFYHNSTNGGYNWSAPQRLSDGSGSNSSGCLASEGTNIISAWQETSGSTHNVTYSRSTDGGTTWSVPSNITTGLTVMPNPVLTIAFGKIYLAYCRSSGIYNCTSNNNGASWTASSILPGTSSTSGNPALTTNSAGWLFLSYDDGTYIYTDYNSGSGWTAWSGTITDNSREGSNTLGSISGDSNNFTHYVWQAWDHVYNLGVVCYRGVNYQGFNWTPITEFAYYYTPYRPTVMGHLDAGGGATVLFSDNNNNIHQVENNGSSWNAGWGVPAQVVASNGNYPSLIEKADSLQAAYLWTDISGAPYAVHYDFRGSGAMGKNLAASNNLLYHRCVDLQDKSKNAFIDIELSDFTFHTQSGQSETAEYAEPSKSISLNTMNSTDLIGMFQTKSITISTNADTLYLQLSYHSLNQNTFKMNSSSAVVFDILGTVNGSNITLGKYNVPDNVENNVEGIIQLPVPASLLGKNVNLKLIAENISNSPAQGNSWDYNLINLYVEDKLNNAVLAKANTVQLFASTSGYVPTQFYLDQNYPNPFNPSTIISYDLPKAGQVTLKVYDILGKEVATLYNGNQNAGTYNVSFDASNLSSGIYFYQLKSGNYSSIKKMILLK